MLPKTHRLNLKAIANRGVFSAERFNSESFSANFDFKGVVEHALVNMVVSKKQYKLAVKRNKAKRLIWGSLNMKVGEVSKLRLIIRPKKNVFETKPEDLRSELDVLFEKISK